MNTAITLKKEDLLKIPYSEKLKAVENGKYSEETLKILANDDDEEIRESVACVAKDANTQMLLAKDGSYKVRMTLAFNTTNEDVLSILANDYHDIQEIVATKTTSLALLNKLSKNLYASVRQAVAKNSCTSAELLANMASDREEDEFVKVAIIKNPNTNVETLQMMSENENEELDVLCALAESEKANESIFQNLLHCDDNTLLEFIVTNPVASNDILNSIANSVDDAYVEGIAIGRLKERQSTKEALEIMFKNVDIKKLPNEALDFIVKYNIVPDSIKDDLKNLTQSNGTKKISKSER